MNLEKKKPTWFRHHHHHQVERMERISRPQFLLAITPGRSKLHPVSPQN